MESTHIEGKSYFRDDVDTQGLLDKYAGTGHLNETRLGYGNKELVKNINVPGCVVTKSGKKLPITGITIHHSKKRTHIVPYTERSEE